MPTISAARRPLKPSSMLSIRGGGSLAPPVYGSVVRRPIASRSLSSRLRVGIAVGPLRLRVRWEDPHLADRLHARHQYRVAEQPGCQVRVEPRPALLVNLDGIFEVEASGHTCRGCVGAA